MRRVCIRVAPGDVAILDSPKLDRHGDLGTRLTEPDPSSLEYGQPMRLVADILPSDDGDVVTWAFESAR